MKTLFQLSLVLLVFTFILIGCSTKEITSPQAPAPTRHVSLETNTVKAADYPIWAGQTINAGTLSVSNDNYNIYVSFNMTGGWLLEQTHVQVAIDVNGIPHTSQGIPIPGQFDYKTDHNPMVTTYSYTIPLYNYTFQVGDVVTIAAHCTVYNPDYEDGDQHQTGWGGDIYGDGPRWWWYLQYTLTPPDDNHDYQYETAMMRMNDVANDFTYRWIMVNHKPHAWFSYVKTTPTAIAQTYYFYAGRSNKCGEVQIWKEGDYLKVQANLMNGWEMNGSHLNVQLTGFSGAPAFGLFPYTTDHTPAVTTYTYSVPWNTAWDGMELNVALHGAVQKEVTP